MQLIPWLTKTYRLGLNLKSRTPLTSTQMGPRQSTLRRLSVKKSTTFPNSISKKKKTFSTWLQNYQTSSCKLAASKSPPHLALIKSQNLKLSLRNPKFRWLGLKNRKVKKKSRKHKLLKSNLFLRFLGSLRKVGIGPWGKMLWNPRQQSSCSYSLKTWKWERHQSKCIWKHLQLRERQASLVFPSCHLYRPFLRIKIRLWTRWKIKKLSNSPETPNKCPKTPLSSTNHCPPIRPQINRKLGQLTLGFFRMPTLKNPTK